MAGGYQRRQLRGCVFRSYLLAPGTRLDEAQPTSIEIGLGGDVYVVGRNQCLAVFQHGIRPLCTGGGQVVVGTLPRDRVPTEVLGFGLPREHEFPDHVFHSIAVSRVEFGQAAPHRFGFGLAGQKRHQFAWRAPVYLVGFVQFSGVHVQLAFAIADAIARQRVVVGPRLSGPAFVYLDGRQNVLGHGGFVDVAGVEIEAVIR